MSDSKPEASAFTQYQWIDTGLTKTEYFALHLMAASVTANNCSIPQNMTTEQAHEHATSAFKLARALMHVLRQEGQK